MTSYYEQAKALGVSDSVIAGMDLLTDHGMPPERAAELMVAAERSGKDPEAMARHLLHLARALKEDSS